MHSALFQIFGFWYPSPQNLRNSAFSGIFKAIFAQPYIFILNKHKPFVLSCHYLSVSLSQTKLIFMGGVLESYEKLLGHMLKQLPTPSPQITGSNAQPGSAITAASSSTNNSGSLPGTDVRSELNYILKKVQELKKHRYHEQEKLLQGLETLRDIKVESTLIASWL